jgi:hypothetical protein
MSTPATASARRTATLEHALRALNIVQKTRPNHHMRQVERFQQTMKIWLRASVSDTSTS